jgi:2-polyprenyl-3-methyl-5-hydroxy-6-metoxy-1,4-benzoquinol methylase
MHESESPKDITPPIEYLSPATTVRMADEWFDVSDLDHFWVQWRFQALMRHSALLPKTGSSVLEVGCGHGLVRAQLETEMDYTVDACDLNELPIKKIQGGKGRLLVYDIMEKHPDMCQKYEAVFLMDVLEHIEQHVSFLNSCLYHIKPGGLVAINVPAFNMLFSRYDARNGHVRRYNKPMMKALLAEAGVELIAISYWGLPMLPIILLRKYYLNLVAEDKIMESGFRPPSTLVHMLFKLLKSIEIQFPYTPPVGTSLIALGRVRS